MVAWAWWWSSAQRRFRALVWGAAMTAGLTATLALLSATGGTALWMLWTVGEALLLNGTGR